jgi:hypothetical protein
MPDDGPHGRNTKHPLTNLIKSVVVDSNKYETTVVIDGPFFQQNKKNCYSVDIRQ